MSAQAGVANTRREPPAIPAEQGRSTLAQILDARDEHANALNELLAERGGDITDDEERQIIDDWLAEGQRPVKVKVNGFGWVIRERERLAAARRVEAERLLALAHTDENIVKRLKERLLYFFEFEGVDRLETEHFKFSVAQNGGKAPLIVYALPEDLPGKFQRVEVAPNNEKIRAALEAGEQLTFAELGPRGRHLRVR